MKIADIQQRAAERGQTISVGSVSQHRKAFFESVKAAESERPIETEAGVNMKAAHRDPLKEARDTITFATVFTLTVTGPPTLIAGVILLAVSRSEWLASIVFVGMLAAAILGMFWWPRHRLTVVEEQITVHAFVSHFRMHPELLPQGRTEFDLERFRKQWSGRNQMTLDAWIKQFSREIRTTSQFR
jgi:hypothetical protein